MNFNKVILAGNLTRDPQLSYTPSQTAVCEFGMAVNRRYKGADGQQRDDVCFVDCQAWGKTGEIINQYMTKGRPLLVEGRLTYESWENKDGQKRSRLRVTVENFQFLGGQKDDGSQERRPANTNRPAPPNYNDTPPPPPPTDGPTGGKIPY